MLQEFITSSLVIDDDFEEVKDLISYLEDQKDIWVKYYSPSEVEKKTIPFNNRKIIFLDLYLDDSRSSTDNIALIRKYFKSIIGENFGTYGIVLWTKHINHFEDFCSKIFLKNNPFTLPLFVIPLDKTKFKKQGNYQGVLTELEEMLENDVSSSFFVEWNKAVKKGSDKTISTLYNLFESNEEKNKHLEAVLFNLACNYTGIPVNIIPKDSSVQAKDAVNTLLNQVNPFLQKDLVKSLMDSLQVEISNNHNDIKDLFLNPNKLKYDSSNGKTRVFSKLNSLLLLDFQNLSQDIALPGNIYEVLENQNQIYFKSFYNKDIEIKLEDHKDFKEKGKDTVGNEIDVPKVIKRIAIEVTPPCDFAGKKKQLQSRIVGGVMLDYDKKIKDTYFKGEAFYSFLHPIQIEGIEKPQMAIFDFYKFQTINESDLINKCKFKVIMKTKDKLFADILQKLSSHTARLGIAALYP
ncbi:hypothetical protein [Algoriphagus boritolerans]|uniref:Response receiver domain-containing protein n=1 Tax=Algoriphagus boritolerans DSM 17298 = JCM 18970 TaxID=1120964 RepID=A0A1H5XV19_9BACT|nr:hypothetical protein [Algoriphagus boritolerans]SEG15512.1 hypothetical protein SAMN03080598_02693 [Algoriphagus boritolerans DSM 17298 = JCM 18970]